MMLRLLKEHRVELGIPATDVQFDSTIARTLRNLHSSVDLDLVLTDQRLLVVDKLAAAPVVLWECERRFVAATKVTSGIGYAGRPLWEHERFVTEVHSPLVAGRDARYHRWHWTAVAPGDELTVPAGVPVIVEGVHTMDDAVQVPWDVRVWVDVDRELRLDRARAREGGARWVCWSANWMPREDAYVSEQQPSARADLVVDGDSAPR